WRADDSSGASTVKRNALPTCTSWTPSKPSAGSARSMVAPCGSAMPGRRRTSTSTGNLTRSLSHAVPVGKGLSGDALVGGDVALPRRVDDCVGQVRRRRLLVPTLCLEPVAQRLLVERRGRGAGLPFVRGPEARGAGREHLVADGEGAVDQADLELGAG